MFLGQSTIVKVVSLWNHLSCSVCLLDFASPSEAILWLLCFAYPTPHLLSEWREEEKRALSRRSCLFPPGRRWKKDQGKRETELVQMNNLYRIPGIVCQGDDGRSVSKPKQTVGEHTLTHSREVDEVTEGCETAFILIVRLETVIKWCDYSSLGVCMFLTNWWQELSQGCQYVYRSCKILTKALKDCQHDVSCNEIVCNLFENGSFPYVSL